MRLFEIRRLNMHNFFLSLFANNSFLPRGGKMFSRVLARASHWIHLCSELNFILGKIERTHQHTELHFQCTLMDKVHIYIHWNWLAQEDQCTQLPRNTADHSFRRRQCRCHRIFLCILPDMHIPCIQTCCQSWLCHPLLALRIDHHVGKHTC